jgi:hypothetical protein
VIPIEYSWQPGDPAIVSARDLALHRIDVGAARGMLRIEIDNEVCAYSCGASGLGFKPPIEIPAHVPINITYTGRADDEMTFPFTFHFTEIT